MRNTIADSRLPLGRVRILRGIAARMPGKKSTVVLMSLALTVLIGAFTPATSPAMAHDAEADVPGGRGGVVNLHTYVFACDERADGWGVRTYYWLRSGGTGAVGDANGSAAPCGGRTVTTTSNPVVYYQVCTGPNGQDWECAPRTTA